MDESLTRFEGRLSARWQDLIRGSFSHTDGAFDVTGKLGRLFRFGPMHSTRWPAHRGCISGSGSGRKRDDATADSVVRGPIEFMEADMIPSLVTEGRRHELHDFFRSNHRRGIHQLAPESPIVYEPGEHGPTFMIRRRGDGSVNGSDLGSEQIAEPGIPPEQCLNSGVSDQVIGYAGCCFRLNHGILETT